MLNRKGPRPILLLLIVCLLAVAPLPASAQTQSDVDNAKENVEQADAAKERAYQELLDANQAVGEAISELEALDEKIQELEYLISRLQGQITDFADQVADLEQNARDVVIEAYVAGGTGLVTAAFAAGTIQDLLTSQVLIDNAADRDLAELDLLAAVNRQNDRLKEDLAEREEEVEEARTEQLALVAKLETAREHAEEVLANAEENHADMVVRYKEELKQKAEADAARRRAEAAARAAASGAAAGLPSSSTPGLVCPVAGNTWFIDTWGAARSGGRTHKGTDMAAARGTPVVAVNHGSIRLNWHALGGRQVYLYSGGNFYYYAHLSGYAAGLSSGRGVSKGQLLGYVGATGNATANVLHFGMGPSSGRFVNPYPTLRRIC
jgi:murein DD-endopeptidase MepM/ murein hydrolase activator NlpD